MYNLNQIKPKMKRLFSCFSRQDSRNDKGQLRRKMVIVGDGECGKTCLVTRMTTGNFVDIGYIPTVFETEVVNVNTGNENVELLIFDTAGQEDYDRLRPLSYDEVDVVLICFSLQEPDTLQNVMENWAPEIRYFCGKVPVILVGNKKDLRDCQSSLSSSKASLESRHSQTDDLRTKSASRASVGSGQDQLTDNSSSCDVIATSDHVQEKSGHDSKAKTFYSTSRPVYRVAAPVKHSEGVLTANRIGAMAYFETSALTGENVEELLLATTKAAVLGSKKCKKFKPFNDSLKSWRSVGELTATQ